MCERLGKVDLGGLYADEDMLELCLNSYRVYLEEAFRAVRRESLTKPKIQALSIIDLEGLSWNSLWHVGMISKITAVGPPNFPEITKKVYIIRAPVVFQSIWSAISGLLPEKTRNKVNVLGEDYLEVLAKNVNGGLESLPKFLGGGHEATSVCPAMLVEELQN